MVDWSREPIQMVFRYETQCMEGHSTFEPGPAGNILEIGTLYTLILQTPMDELRPTFWYVEL